MEKETIQIDIALSSPAHITITTPLFSRKVPTEEEINQFICRTLNEDVVDAIVYKNVVIRL